jgi:hypothetical protein
MALRVRDNRFKSIAKKGAYVVIDWSERQPKDGQCYFIRHASDDILAHYRVGHQSFEVPDVTPMLRLTQKEVEVVGRVAYVINTL